jgi:hypothetical protein
VNDYFGRLLGLSGANIVRPRLPGLFEPVNALPEDDLPVPSGPPRMPRTEPVVTLPANTAQPRPLRQETVRRQPATATSEASSHENERGGTGDSPAMRSVRPGPWLVRDPVHAVREIAPERVRPGVESLTAEPARVTPIQPVASAMPITPVTSGASVTSTASTASTAPVVRIGQPVRPPTVLPTRHPVAAAPTPAAAPPTQQHQQQHHQQQQHYRQQRRDRVEPAPPSEPVIRVNIGRIEVTATTPPASPPRRASKPRSSTQSLASYLAERDGGRT